MASGHPSASWPTAIKFHVDIWAPGKSTVKNESIKLTCWFIVGVVLQESQRKTVLKYKERWDWVSAQREKKLITAVMQTGFFTWVFKNGKGSRVSAKRCY